MLAWDDLTNMKLDAGKVKEERAKELDCIRGKRVYAKIPRSQAVRNGWKVIKTRWIDQNKGDDANPVYRSRLVGKEFNNEQMDGLFAGTPPLEALRYLVHEAATVRVDEPVGSKVIMVNDVAPARYSKRLPLETSVWRYPRRISQRRTSAAARFAISV